LRVQAGLSKLTAAEGAIGAIDLFEEHHDIVGISAGAAERFEKVLGLRILEPARTL
jgi:hypothetical protein